jgi:hypothetical protein
MPRSGFVQAWRRVPEHACRVTGHAYPYETSARRDSRRRKKFVAVTVSTASPRTVLCPTTDSNLANHK